MDNFDRYIRNMQLDGFGPDGQRRVRDAKVLIVGCGALGTVTAMYLAAAGVGRIGLVDFDTIDITNLQRQLSYTEADLGRPKVATLAARLRAINSEVAVDEHNIHLSADNIGDIITTYDIVVEGSDNPATKYLVTDAAIDAVIPYVLGGVAQFRGQVTSWIPGAPAYRDIFPDAADTYVPAAVGGVLGSVPGIVGSIQATEVIKIITGIGSPLAGRLLLFDARSMQFSVLSL